MTRIRLVRYFPALCHDFQFHSDLPNFLNLVELVLLLSIGSDNTIDCLVMFAKITDLYPLCVPLPLHDNARNYRLPVIYVGWPAVPLVYCYHK